MRAISQPELAVDNLHNCLYGKASSDKKASQADKRRARGDYARALGYLGRYAESRKEYGKLLHKSLGESPEQFGVLFQRRESALDYVEYYKSL